MSARSAPQTSDPASTGLYRFRLDATAIRTRTTGRASMLAADRSLTARLFTVRVVFTSGAGDARGAPIAREALAPRQEGRSGLAVSRKHLSGADQTSRPAPATKTPDSGLNSQAADSLRVSGVVTRLRRCRAVAECGPSIDRQTCRGETSLHLIYLSLYPHDHAD